MPKETVVAGGGGLICGMTGGIPASATGGGLVEVDGRVGDSTRRGGALAIRSGGIGVLEELREE